MIIVSLGGSIVAPEEVDTAFIVEFCALVRRYITAEKTRRLVIIIGGGALARRYQQAYRHIQEGEGDAKDSVAQDWIGVMATRLNAELLRHTLHPLCTDPVVFDPTEEIPFTGSVLIGAGWKPGFSTDMDAVLLAKRFGISTVINLSNTAQVYTADPREDAGARPLDHLSWSDFRAIIGEEWVPGRNLPFDPVAAHHASELGMRVIVADGKNHANTEAIFENASFVGTVIGPD